MLHKFEVGDEFTIKDGRVVGNPEDALKNQKKLIAAWKIGSR